MSHRKHMMKTILIAVFTALLLPGLASAAQSKIIFTFDLTFDEGPLDGDTFTGSFTLNGFTGSGLEVFLPPGSSEPGGTGKLLAFEIEVVGNVFTMRDDVEFPDLPLIDAEEGMISYMDYGGVSNNGVRLRLDGSPGIAEPSIVWYEDDLGTKSFGYWNNVQVAAPLGGCPAFNTSMVNAAWLAIDYSQPGPPELLDLNDDPAEPNMLCVLGTDTGSEFLVSVGGGEAGLMGRGINIDNPEPITTLLRTRVFNLNKAEQHACRAQVLASFPWRQHCSPMLP